MHGRHMMHDTLPPKVRNDVPLGWREFLVTDLGPEDIVLGLPWLRSVNPDTASVWFSSRIHL